MVVKKKTPKRSIFALPRKRKFPLGNKRQGISAVAYAKKGVKDGTLTVKERNIVLRKVHAKFPSIHITPVRKTKGKWDEATEKSLKRHQKKQDIHDYYDLKNRDYQEYGREAEERKRFEVEKERERKQENRDRIGREYREAHGLD